jgi:hypothetical protein
LHHHKKLESSSFSLGLDCQIQALLGWILAIQREQNQESWYHAIALPGEQQWGRPIFQVGRHPNAAADS